MVLEKQHGDRHVGLPPPGKHCMEKHIHGTYAEITLDPQSKNYISSLMESLELENPIDPDDLHTTVVYSKNPCPDAARLHKLPTPFVGRITEFKIWPTQTGSNCLVAIVECDMVTKLHQHFRQKYKASHDYDQYIPHITLSYNCKNSYQLPQGNHQVRYRDLNVRPLDPDWLKS